MKRFDYYIILSILLIVGLGMLYLGETLYSGVFLGIFITKIEGLLNVERDKAKKVLENYSGKQPEVLESYTLKE